MADGTMRPCMHCSGSGRLRCDDCNNGIETCGRCRGNGKLVQALLVKPVYTKQHNSEQVHMVKALKDAMKKGTGVSELLKVRDTMVRKTGKFVA